MTSLYARLQGEQPDLYPERFAVRLKAVAGIAAVTTKELPTAFAAFAAPAVDVPAYVGDYFACIQADCFAA